ncbi:MAG: ABC transporter substrate-binding protein, partial [Anaerolineae bacterium]
MNKKLSAALILVMVFTLLLSACGATPEPEVVEVEKVVTQVVQETVKETVIVEGTPEVVEREVEVEKVVTATPEPMQPEGTVVVGVWQEPAGLIWNIFYQAHTSNILASMYYDPVALDENDELVPELLTEIPTVENGGISEDGLTYTLKFKDGVKWHDGEPVTAEDFAFTWQFIV